MKVLFLDIDGVLNSRTFLHQLPNGTNPIDHIDPKCLALLKDVVFRINLNVVLSSTWRRIWKREVISNKLGIPLIASTPALNFRGEEILAWLADHEDVRHYVVVDDEVSFLGGIDSSRIVGTDVRVGLTEADVKKIEKLF